MINESKEINEFENEKLVLDKKTNVFRNAMADQLINGVGDQIIEYIKNPPKPTKKTLFKIKMKRFLDNIFQTI